MGAPVVECAELLGHGAGNAVAQAEEGEDDGEEGEGGGLGVEAADGGLFVENENV